MGLQSVVGWSMVMEMKIQKFSLAAFFADVPYRIFQHEYRMTDIGHRRVVAHKTVRDQRDVHTCAL